MNSSRLIEYDLVSRIQKGDAQAEQELFQCYNILEVVQSMVDRRCTLGLEEKNDIASDILLAIIVNIRDGKFDPSRSSLSAYMWGVARNRVNDFFRTLYAKGDRALPLREEILGSNLEEKNAREERQAMKSILDILDWKYREILILRYYEEMNVQDIASVLDLTTVQVNSRLYYGLDILRGKKHLIKSAV